MSRRVPGQPNDAAQLDLPFGIRRMAAPRAIEPLTVTVADALRITGIGRTKLYELIGTGDLATAKIGRRTLVMVDSLRALIDRGRQL